MTIERSDKGQFKRKGEELREVYSVRLTPKAWLDLGYKANSLGMSRSDLLEQIALLSPEDDIQPVGMDEQTIMSVMAVIDCLMFALKMPGNKGKAIKEQINFAVTLLLKLVDDKIDDNTL